MKKDENEKYIDFFREFGRVLKEGIHYDYLRKEQIADLLLFQSTKTDTGKFTTLQGYIEAMKPGQEEIYYITGTKTEEIVKSPYLETFRAKEYEVLIMPDEIDDLIMGGLLEFRGKKIKSVIKGDISLDGPEESVRDSAKQKYEKRLGIIRDQLKDDVKDVRLSGRLLDSACCLVMDEGDIDPGMEKLLKAMGQDIPANRRTLEINPSHPVFESINSVIERDGSSASVREYIDLLYNQALLLEGSKPKDPTSFAKSLAKLILENTQRPAA
jgi:molecular chaperone HtpG